MSDELSGMRVAFLVADEGVEQRELTEPWAGVRDAGGEPVLLARELGDVQCFRHLDRADTAPVDVVVADAGVLDGRTLTSWPSLKTGLTTPARPGSTRWCASTDRS